MDEGVKSPEPSLSRTNAIRSHIDTGIQLLRANRFEEAKDHLCNREKYKGTDISVMPGNVVQIPDHPLSPEEIKYYADDFARKSHTGEKGNIELAEFVGTFQIKDLADVKKMAGFRAPEALIREAAFVTIEEWLHVLQSHLGKPIAGYLNREIDVAAYLIKKGVKLSPTYLERYNRAKALDAVPGEEYLSSLHIGSFVKVARRDGSIDTDWQIVDADLNNNKVTVKRNRLTKVIDYSELIHQNTLAIGSPFDTVTTTNGLIAKIMELGGVQGSNQYYDSTYLINVINDLSTGKASLEQITNEGGLRKKVQTLIPY